VVAFGAGHLMITSTGWHCAHPEQPSLWNSMLAAALEIGGFPRFSYDTV
jgi:hypothetical protein